MDKEVLIHVRGLQTIDADGDQEPVEIVVPGQYYFRNGSHYLRYEEILEDFAEPTINYIKISPKGMEVRKKGVVALDMNQEHVADCYLAIKAQPKDCKDFTI